MRIIVKHKSIASIVALTLQELGYFGIWVRPHPKLDGYVITCSTIKIKEL